MNKRYRLHLGMDEREALEGLVSKGKGAARKLTHARALLLTDEGEHGPAWHDADIAAALSINAATVERVRRRAVEAGPGAALVPKPSSRRYTTRLDGEAEAHLIATACSAPPGGRSRWTLTLLADRLVMAGVVESVCRETVRQTLKKTRSSRTRVCAG